MFARVALCLSIVLAGCPKGGGGISPLSDVGRRAPPVTTSFDDHEAQFPFADDFQPEFDGVQQIAREQVTEDGTFDLSAGLWRYAARSYCLKAGTYAPGETEGSGYVSAPLEGPKSDIVQSILRRSVTVEDVSQSDVQYLLWAIIARTALDEMSPELQSTAARLLTPAELAQWGGDSVVREAGEMFARSAWAMLPEPLRKIQQVEAEIRGLSRRADSTYEDVEELAVLTGAWPPDPSAEQVPRGRWSWHSSGVFVRYEPSGYRRTETTYYVPEPVGMERDDLGRITSMTRDDGWAIRTTYAEGPGRVVAEDPSMTAYRFASIELTQPSGESFSLSDTGYVFFDTPPESTGRFVAKSLPANKPMVIAQSDDWDEWGNRVERARAAKGEYDCWKGHYDDFAAGGTTDDVLDVGRYQDGLEAATTGTPADRAGWLADHFAGVAKAWWWAVCQLRGNCGEDVDPSDDLASPANQSGQRLGQSAQDLDW